MFEHLLENSNQKIAFFLERAPLHISIMSAEGIFKQF